MHLLLIVLKLKTNQFLISDKSKILRKRQFMKKSSFLLFTIIPLILCSCANSNNGPKKYTINFYNDDRATLLYTTDVEENVMPVYQGVYPTKAADAQYTYKFDGWDPTLSVATKNENYYAKYKSVINTITINIDGEESVVEYGSHIEEPESPADVLSADRTTIDVFVGWYIQGTNTKWNFATDTVTTNVVLEAKFETLTAYKATFMNGDEVFFEDYFGENQIPSYRGQDIPNKEPTEKLQYDFKGWSPDFTPIQSNMTYHATFNETARKYLIKFVNYDNRVLYSEQVTVDTLPTYKGDTPTKPSDATYYYEFKGWDPVISVVTGEQTYVATYNQRLLNGATVTINQYIDNETTPAYSEQVEVAKNTKYIVPEEYRELKASGYEANKYTLADSESVDVYIIAGQSNASGYSMVNQISSTDIKDNYPTSTSVLYYGVADYNKVENFSTFVDFGYGAAYDRFGAEVGMAKAIQSLNPSGKSLILKTAFGGTFLTDDHVQSVSKAFGNWCPPSSRNPETLDEAITGKCYDSLLDNIDNVISYYHSEGYSVRLAGTFWMQGEAESGTAESGSYGDSLEVLIKDLRHDYESRFDSNGQEAEFVIGKIAPDFAGGHEGVDNVRSEQERIAKKLENVTALESYRICENGEPKPGCIDKYHFSADDMLNFGERISNVILEKLSQASTTKNIFIYQVIDDMSIDIYFERKSETNYKIKYHLKGNDGYYHLNEYEKTVYEFEDGEKILSGDEVEITDFTLPSELIDLPDKGLGNGWEIDLLKSYYKGVVSKGGKTTFELYFELSFGLESANNMRREGDKFVVTKYSSYSALGSYYMLGTKSDTAFISVEVPNNLVALDELNSSYGGICFGDGTLTENGTPHTMDYGICNSGLVFASDATGGRYCRSPIIGSVNDFYYDKDNHTSCLGGGARELSVALYEGRIYLFIEGLLVADYEMHSSVVPAVSFPLTATEYSFGIYAARSIQANMTLTLKKELYGTEAHEYFDSEVKKAITVKQTINGVDVPDTEQTYYALSGKTFTVPEEFLTLADQGDGKYYVFDNVAPTTFVVSEDTTININFVEADLSSYKINYYYQLMDASYEKCDYVKTVSDVYAGVSVTADVTEPSEITRPVDNSISGGYVVDTSNSVLTGVVKSDGSLELSIYYRMAYTYVKDVKVEGNDYINQSLPVYLKDVGNFYTLGTSKTAVISVLIKQRYMDRPGCTNTCGISVMKGIYGSTGWNSTDFSLSNVGLRTNNSLTYNKGRESSNLNAYYNADQSVMNDQDRALTIVLYNSTLYVYIDAKLIKTYATTLTEPLCGYTADTALTFALYFANNAETGKTLTLLTSCFGDEALSYIAEHYSGDITIQE